MSDLMTRIARRLRAERGFTMVYVMLFMVVGSLFAVGAWTAANGDIKGTQTDQDSKAAYAAAESGLNWYLFQLNQNNGFWTDCVGGTTLSDGSVNPVNARWDGTGVDPRRFRAMPGNTGASYAIEPLPVAAPPAQCIVGAGAAGSMLNANGDLTVRATGKVGNVKRTVVGSLTRAGFLDYLYFTDKETLDPVVYQGKLSGTGKGALNCDVYRRDGRSASCTDIVFANNDFVKGPFHTNDNFLACGSPTFGRTLGDNIEVSDPAGFGAGCGGTATPQFKGTYTKGVATLQMPPTNAAIKDNAQGAYSFKGITKIQLNDGGTMNITNAAAGYNNKLVSWPSNGVIYVDNTSACGQPYDLVQDYDDPSNCADVYVHGTYSKSLTIATKRDAIVDGNIIRNGNVVLGLIADNFVRVYHPVTPASRTTETCTATSASSPKDVRIDAAILALNHSFIVDNYYCGGTLGTLTINGAIGQHFRGPVGTGGTTISTGYWKDYNYDDRLKKVNPPYFLDPVNSAWKLDRFNEQIPAT